MDYVFPIPDGRVSTGFWDLRPYSIPVDQRTYIHRAWDFTCKSTPRQRILAPEDGAVFYQAIMRSAPSRQRDHTWPEGGWYLFSNFYYDNMGALAILQGKESGLMYCFCHLDIDIMVHMLEGKHIPYEWVQHRWSYNDYVRWIITFNNKRTVLQGDTIGWIGDAGYSSGYHTHMQVHASVDYNSRIDPAALWPDVDIYDNGAGPSKGPRPGADRIPTVNLSMNYIRY